MQLQLKMKELLAKANRDYEGNNVDQRDNSEDRSNQNFSKEDQVLNAVRKALLMELFHRSGPAKLPSILNHINNFLGDPFSGKVCVIL